MGKILLLEDDFSLAEGLTFALNKQGYEVVEKRTITPLAELLTASEKIANNDLDFSIENHSKDELGNSDFVYSLAAPGAQGRCGSDNRYGSV